MIPFSSHKIPCWYIVNVNRPIFLGDSFDNKMKDVFRCSCTEFYIKMFPIHIAHTIKKKVKEKKPYQNYINKPQTVYRSICSTSNAITQSGVHKKKINQLCQTEITTKRTISNTYTMQRQTGQQKKYYFRSKPSWFSGESTIRSRSTESGSLYW